VPNKLVAEQPAEHDAIICGRVEPAYGRGVAIVGALAKTNSEIKSRELLIVQFFTVELQREKQNIKPMLEKWESEWARRMFRSRSWTAKRLLRGSLFPMRLRAHSQSLGA
jgi:hypothetical protein